MPATNPYDFGGSFSQGALSGGSGGGMNPYAGYLQQFMKQRQQHQQKIEGDTMAKLQAMIAAMRPGVSQPPQGALSTPPGAVASAADVPMPEVPTDLVYNPSGYLKNLGIVESSDKYDAVNPASGAGGKYQFIQKTWDDLGKQNPALALTPEGRTGTTDAHKAEQERAARALSIENAKILKSTLGRAPTHTETYIAHLLGPGYGSQVLRNPETRVETLVPESFIKANPFLRGIDGKTLLQMFAKKFAR
jgi:3-oxoacyl-(acyl-carrier-protein) synthase